MRYIVIAVIVIAGCSETAQKQVVPTSNERSLSFTLTSKTAFKIPPAGKELKLWIPLVQSTKFQEVSNVRIETSAKYRITTDPLFGNTAIFIEGAVDKPVEVTWSAKIRRFEATTSEETISPELLARSKNEDRLGPINEKILAIAEKISGENQDYVRGVYDYIIKNWKYDKETAGWGKGDVMRAIEICKGNCSDFHAPFNALCRAKGIPSMFYYGLAIPWGKETGNGVKHCWATALVDGKLLPVDLSESWKNQSMREYYFGHLDERRVEISRGRDITLEPKQSGDALNFFIDAYAEVDGKPFDGVETTYTFSTK